MAVHLIKVYIDFAKFFELKYKINKYKKYCYNVKNKIIFNKYTL